MGSIRNTVVVAIMQVGVIVAGVLGAGIGHNIWARDNRPIPLLVAVLYGYGVVGFFIPLAWSFGAVMLQLRSDVSDDVKSLIFWIGVLILIALIIFVVYADVSPWLRIEWAPAGGDDGDMP
jgi:hypothetical protein